VLLANDTDVDNDTLVIASVTSLAGGTAELGSNGAVTFTAESGFTGSASFSYTVSDGHGGFDTASVALDVTAPPEPTGSVIVGTSGRDVLWSTPGNDIFYGLDGRDTFVFRPQVGDDVIKDFETSQWFWKRGDVLDLRGNGFDSFWDLIKHIHGSGHDTLIDLPDGGSVLLEGVHPFRLHFDNFRIF
jgi:hypothetical protein